MLITAVMNLNAYRKLLASVEVTCHVSGFDALQLQFQGRVYLTFLSIARRERCFLCSQFSKPSSTSWCDRPLTEASLISWIGTSFSRSRA